MEIDQQDNRASIRSRWGLPLGVATGVAAVSVAAVAIFGGLGDAKPPLAAPALSGGSPTSAAASPSPSTTRGSASGGVGSGPSSAAEKPTATVISTTTTPIDAGTAAKILASCMGSDAPQYHVAVAVRTPIATKDWDGVLVAVNSAGQYVQCESKGDKGNSPDVPPTFINNRMWGAGHVIEYFDGMGEAAGQGQQLVLGAGHYTSDVARITISYGDNPTQYPAAMAGGAFVYAAAATRPSLSGLHVPIPIPVSYIHAYNASGEEIYNQQKDPL